MNKRLAGINLYKVLLLSLVAFSVYATFFGETTDLFDGYGSDGINYGVFTQRCNELLAKGEVPNKLYDRILPIVIIHNILKATTGELTTEKYFKFKDKAFFEYSSKVVLGFKIYNLAVFLLILFMISRIAKQLQMSHHSSVVFLILTIMNFCNLKQCFFEPVMIDPSFFLHGLLILYFALNKNITALAVTTIAGFAVNELTAYAGILLCCTAGININDNKGQTTVKKAVAISAGGAACVSAIYLLYNPLCQNSLENDTIATVFPLSLVVLFAVIFLGYRQIIAEADLFSFIKNILYQSRWFLLVLLLVLLIAYRKFSNVHSDQLIYPICDNVKQTIFNYLLNAIRSGSSRPAGFLVAHFVYFGIGVILYMLYFKRVAEWIRKAGAGFFLLALLSIPLALNSESRQLIFFHALFSLALCSSVSFSKIQAYALLAVSLILSRAWLPINPLGSDLYLEAVIENKELLFTYPLQKYMMNLGPWMNDKNYVVWLVLASITLAAFYLLQRKGVVAKIT